MTSQIPRYALYGDRAHSDELSLVHSQSLFSNIERQNWQIKPHRHNGLHQFVMLSSGEIDATIDGSKMRLVGPVVASIPTNCVHGFGYSPHARGRIITVTDTFLSAVVDTSPSPSAYNWLKAARVITVDDSSATNLPRLDQCLDRIELELRLLDAGAFDAIASAMKLFLIDLMRATQYAEPSGHKELDNYHRKIARQFQTLAARHYRDHWGISTYSDQIGVTSKQLSRICQNLFGQSPLAYLHDLLNREAQRRLIYTNASVTETCYDLGFKDPAYFSRFFRRLNNVSPKQFIESRRAGFIAAPSR